MRGTRRYKHVIETPDPGKWELAGYEASLPITEKSNPITKDLDRADPVQMVQLLRDCDAEIFQEEDAIVNYKRLYSESVLKTVFDIAKKVKEILKEPEDGLIVLSGCGTSGRLALLLANSFNKLLKGLHRTSCYTYIISGGDRALVTSQEAPEDSPSLGIAELQKVCEGKKKVIFFGISCGLSAAFVAGQLDYCLNNLDVFVPVMVGFNPVSMASLSNLGKVPDSCTVKTVQRIRHGGKPQVEYRGHHIYRHKNGKEVIEGWHSSFFQVAERMQKLQETQNAFILNPAVGPEGICGSSRMKGGSATKILLETLFLVAHKADSDVLVSEKCLLEILRTYERAHKVTYTQSKKIAALVKQAGTSLQKKGHLYILGWGTLGLMAIMDAVECIPTYGADYRDIRGFINSGYSGMQNNEADLTSLGPEFAISHEDFLKSLLPSVTETDTIVFTFTLDDDLANVEKLALQVKEKTSNVQAISHATAGQYLPPSLKKVFPSIISATWPILFLEYEGVFIQKFQRELSTKWILNTVSTGAHVIKGKVFRNYMVDFRVSNSKLFTRAVSVLQRLSGQSQARSTDTLLRSIYGTEVLSDDIRGADISRHVEEASTKEKVVSTAIVSLLRNCAVHEARERLDTYPTIRAAVEASLNAIGRKRSVVNIEMRSLDT